MTAHLIVLPGGGYRTLASHEGQPVAEWLTQLGLSAEVCEYPVRCRHPARCKQWRTPFAELVPSVMNELG